MSDWQPIETAPFGWHSEDDDGSVEWGHSKTKSGKRNRVPEVSAMAGWDFYWRNPTHWRPK